VPVILMFIPLVQRRVILVLVFIVVTNIALVSKHYFATA
jgi:hypothetical protein